MAGSNTIGTGAVVLTANADKLLTGLKKAEKETESWAQRTYASANKAAKGIDDKVGGGIGESIAPVKDMAKGMLVDVAKQGAQAFLKWATGADGLNKLLADTERLMSNIAATTERLAAKRLEWIDSIAAPDATADAISREIKRGEADRASLVQQIKAAEDAREDLNKFNFRTQGLRIAGNLDRFQGAADAKVQALRGQLDSLHERQLSLSDRMGNLKNPDLDPAKVGEINRLTESLDRQAATLGMAAEKIKAYELAADRFSEKQVREYVIAADKLTKTVEGFESVANAVGGAAGFVGGGDPEKIKEITAALKKQSDTWGMTANQIQLYDLRIAKFAERQIKEIEKLQDSTESLLNTFNIASAIANGFKDTKLESGGPYVSGAALGGSMEAYSAVASFRASNAIAGGSIGDNPIQIAREQLKISKEQNRKIQRLIDVLDGAQTLKVVV